jgi:hypothetical protein
MTYLSSQEVRRRGLASGDPVWLADKAWRDEVQARLDQRARDVWLFHWLWDIGIGGIGSPVPPYRHLVSSHRRQIAGPA